MELIDAIAVRKTSRIAFVGAGGKSTAMFGIARQSSERTRGTIFVSATTHLGEDQLGLADRHIVVTSIEDVRHLHDTVLDGVVLLTGELGKDHRTQGLSLEIISEVERLAQAHQAPLLVEADGSRRKPLKAPAAHEPVIPPWVTMVVVVAGLSGFGKALSEETVHRPQVFAELSGLKAGEQIDSLAVAQVLLSKTGGLKGIPEQAGRTVLLNQCDTPELAGQAKQISQRLLSEYGQVIVANLEKPAGQEVIAVHRRVAGVVLAAGGSERMGQPKQLLTWQGRAFVRAVAETALEAGLRPVLVVTGAYQPQVEAALQGLPVRMLHNAVWQDGQAGSVRAAVKHLSASFPETRGALFFLADQPQIPVSLVQTLLDAYSTSLVPIVAPLVDDRRGNPVLFDSIAFGELQKLVGDAGGRQVFSRFPVQYVPWLDAKAGLDVDTIEDYHRLLGDD